MVFDGLDELASMGKAAAQVARDFIQAVERMIERRNLGPYPVRVIISGRELIVQENETEFRKPRQVLNILPYVVLEDKEAFRDQGKLLEADLRQRWWKNYGNLVGQNFNGVPSQLQIREIDDITAQPLLNYLVALSYRRGKIDFDKTLNLNAIYADLLAAVHERGYERTRTYRPISHIGLKEFVRVLEEIGLAAWHGSDGRSTSVKDILNHCQQSGLTVLLNSFTEGAQAGTTKLLAAFFFRRGSESAGDDATFVFTHKSFGEYLTATRLVRGLERIVAERQKRRANTDEGFDTVDALIHWVKLTGPAVMTEYLQMFMRREIAQRQSSDLKNWHDVLIELMGHAVENLMPMEKIGNMGHAAASRQEVNSSTALLVALNCVSESLESIAKLQLSSEVSFGTFLRRVCPQRLGPKPPLLYSCLSYLDFSGQCLDIVDLYGANLRNTNWSGVRAHYANFGRSFLDGANFNGAKLNWSRFDDANVDGCSFRSAIIDDAVFDTGIFQLKNSDFSESSIINAVFRTSKMSGCNFGGALMAGADFDGVRVVADCRFDRAIAKQDDRRLVRWAGRNKKSGGLLGSLRLVSASELDELNSMNLMKIASEGISS